MLHQRATDTKQRDMQKNTILLGAKENFLL
jgi:hypothetical protein